MNMKDRIKFSDEMLAAVIAGRKTQTRRLIEPRPKVTEKRLRELDAWQKGLNLLDGFQRIATQIAAVSNLHHTITSLRRGLLFMVQTDGMITRGCGLSSSKR
ncbi:hypothetical protein UA45_10690 [Morganella morganii]|uniref:Uncharacterized protein n=1 Tax=Morganella morganii TaxID=582 RepID=A0A0D8L9I6_MORMO|nr:hypothetical protein UA45_10690 [Morganella morganii]